MESGLWWFNSIRQGRQSMLSGFCNLGSRELFGYNSLWDNNLELVGMVKWASINIQAVVWVDEQSIVLMKEAFPQMNQLEVWFDSSNSAKITELHE